MLKKLISKSLSLNYKLLTELCSICKRRSHFVVQETPIIEIKIKGIEFVSENKMTNIDADTEFTCVITRATSSHSHIHITHTNEN